MDHSGSSPSSFWLSHSRFDLWSLPLTVIPLQYYRPVFVVPNFTALIVGIFMHLFAFGVCIGRILSQSKNYQVRRDITYIYQSLWSLQVNDYQESIIVYCCGLFIFALLMTFFFIIFVMKYHSYLRMRYGHQVPKVFNINILFSIINSLQFVQSRGPRTGYQDEMYWSPPLIVQMLNHFLAKITI